MTEKINKERLVAGWSHKWNTQNIIKWNGQVIRKWNGLE